jgi:hypothetical protein
MRYNVPDHLVNTDIVNLVGRNGLESDNVSIFVSDQALLCV